MSIDRFLGNGAVAWFPPVLFVIILLFALGTGFYKGWRTALYYMVFDWLAVLIGIFVAGPVVVAIAGATTTGQVDLGQYMQDHPAFAPLFLIAWLPILRVIGFALHFFLLRTRFRRYLVENEMRAQIQKPTLRARFFRNGKSRLLGAAISVLGAVPMAVFAANGAALFSGTNALAPLTDSLVTVMSFGIYEGVGKYAPEVRDYFAVVNDDSIDIVRRLLNGEAVDATKLATAHGRVATILRGALLEQALRSLPTNDVRSENITAVIGSATGIPPLAQKFVVTEAEFNHFRTTLTDKFGWPATINWDAIKNAYFEIPTATSPTTTTPAATTTPS